MSTYKNINLKRTVFDKTKFNETIDTSFTQLKDVIDPSFFDLNLATLDDFWSLYEKLFYVIPKEGDINSHQYLAQTSGEYADYNPQQEEIEALLEEIAELREENLEVRQQLADVIIASAPSDGATTSVVQAANAAGTQAALNSSSSPASAVAAANSSPPSGGGGSGPNLQNVNL